MTYIIFEYKNDDIKGKYSALNFMWYHWPVLKKNA